MKAKRALVTGATGFIGSHLTRLLVQKGYDVSILVRPDSNLWRIKDILNSIHLIRGDFFKLEEIEAPIQERKFEFCFHLAWVAEPGKYLTSFMNLDMLNASLTLVSLLANSGCRKLIATGTCFEYDTHVEPLPETTPTHPTSLYAASKLSLSLLLKQLAPMLRIDYSWARLFYQYGPYEDKRRLIPSVIHSLLQGEPAPTTGGKQIRDFLHVEDVASALWAVAESPLTGNVNIGSGKPVTVKEIALKIGDLLNRRDLIQLGKLPFRASDPMVVCADNTLLRESTGWSQQFSLEEGLKNTIDWWKKNAT